MQALPNFLPHVYSIYNEELPKLRKQHYKTIFIHQSVKVLGTGASGTVVYKGQYFHRKIAIKEVSKFLANIADKEISIMLQIDHRNILKYVAMEEDMNNIYIGIELCKCNLQTFITDAEWSGKMENKTIMQQTAAGLSYLHQLNISEY